MKIIPYFAAIIATSTILISPVKAQVSDREAAAIALGAAAIIAGAAIASQHRRKERHYYYAQPQYHYPPPLRHRYYEPVPVPAPYYHNPYRRHWE